MTTRSDVVRLRATVARVLSTHRKGTPYANEFRDEVMRHARERMAAGEMLPAIASEIGISYWTVWGWLRSEHVRAKAPDAEPTKNAIVPVQVVATRPVVARQKSPLTVHGPCGLRIEGADIETIAALVRRLA